MSYVVQNQKVFIAAYVGACGGMGASLRVPTTTNVARNSGLAQVAGAFAESFDTAANGVLGTSTLTVDSVRTLCECVWSERTPVAAGEFLIAATYTNLCNALIAIILAEHAYFTDEGFNPNVPSTPAGPAGGDLRGTYPDPFVQSLSGTEATSIVNGSFQGFYQQDIIRADPDTQCNVSMMTESAVTEDDTPILIACDAFNDGVVEDEMDCDVQGTVTAQSVDGGGNREEVFRCNLRINGYRTGGGAITTLAAATQTGLETTAGAAAWEATIVAVTGPDRLMFQLKGDPTLKVNWCVSSTRLILRPGAD